MPTRTARLPYALLTLSAASLLAGCGGGGTSAGSSGGGSSSGATSASLSWTAPQGNTDGTNLTDLSSYHIYYGTAANQLNSMIEVSNTTTSYVISNLAAGTWYFAITAVNSIGVESDLSNTASKTIN
jgi:fibronectin type 3 domain-containing protein